MQPRSLPTCWYTSTRCYITNSYIGKSVHILLGQPSYMLVLVWCACNYSQVRWWQKILKFHCSTWSVTLHTTYSKNSLFINFTLNFSLSYNFQTFPNHLQLRFQHKHHKFSCICSSGIWHCHWVSGAWCFKTIQWSARVEMSMDILTLDDETTMLSQPTGHRSPSHVAPHLRRKITLTALQQKPKTCVW